MRGGDKRYYNSDSLGSTRAIADAVGTVSATKETDAFGNVFATDTTGTQTPFGFAGQHGYQTDADSGLQKLGYRYYDASTGRFLSRDPIQAGYNWYIYCDNDPVNAVDSQGLNSMVMGTVIGGTVAGPPRALGGFVIGAVIGLITIIVVVYYRPGLPMNGPPNSSSANDDGNGNGQIRDYGPDGKPVRDIDFGHDHGVGDPHVHPWSPSPTGGNPIRQPGQAI